MATAHKLARLGCTLLKHDLEYVHAGLDAYEQQFTISKLNVLHKAAKSMDFMFITTEQPVVCSL